VGDYVHDTPARVDIVCTCVRAVAGKQDADRPYPSREEGNHQHEDELHES